MQPPAIVIPADGRRMTGFGLLRLPLASYRLLPQTVTGFHGRFRVASAAIGRLSVASADGRRMPRQVSGCFKQEGRKMLPEK